MLAQDRSVSWGCCADVLDKDLSAILVCSSSCQGTGSDVFVHRLHPAQLAEERGEGRHCSWPLCSDVNLALHISCDSQPVS